jgi:hypothetical protein
MARIAASDEFRVRCMAQVVKGRLAVPRSLAASPELKLQDASAVCKRTPEEPRAGRSTPKRRTRLQEVVHVVGSVTVAAEW